MNLFTDFSSKKYIIFIACVIAFFIAMGELIVRMYIIRIPNTTPYRINKIYTSKNHNIVLGDSHIYRGFINSDIFCNLGRGGTTIPMMNIIATQYYKLKKPHNVVLQASPQLFCTSHINRNTQGYENYFNQNNLIPFKIYLFEPGIGNWIKKIRSMKDIDKLVEDRKKRELHLTTTGSRWKNKKPEDRTKRIIRRIKHQQPNMELSLKYQRIYSEMIERLTNSGANVCLLRTPVDQEYLEKIKNDPSFSESLRFFKEIALIKNVRFVDFQSLNTTFTLDRFINQDHIAADFSKEFSDLVNQACFSE